MGRGTTSAGPQRSDALGGDGAKDARPSQKLCGTDQWIIANTVWI